MDHRAATWLNSLVVGHPAVVRIIKAVTWLGSGGVLWTLTGTAAVVLAIRRRWRLVIYLLVTGAGELTLDPVLKALVGRLRPVVAHPIAHGNGDSFPSGHSLGITWLGITAFAFELSRQAAGAPVTDPVTEGLEPEARTDLKPAEPETTMDHDRARKAGRIAAGVVVMWVLIAGALTGIGKLIMITHNGNGNLLGDHAVPHWFAAHRTSALNHWSLIASNLGATQDILIVSAATCVVFLAVTRRWRPVIFVAGAPPHRHPHQPAVRRAVADRRHDAHQAGCGRSLPRRPPAPPRGRRPQPPGRVRQPGQGVGRRPRIHERE